MNLAQQYLMEARRNKNSQYHNFVDDPHYNYVTQPNLMGYNADGASAPAAPSAPVKKSQPYAITISNSNAANVQNFSVLGAFTFINNAGFDAAGNLTITGITITSAIPGISYREFLYQSMNNPFSVGLTYVSCSNVSAQVQEVFTITTKDANGTTVSIPIVPATDPYQFQNGVQAVDQEYRIDGFTQITFANILPSAIILVRFYPSDNLNQARALGNQPTGRSFGNPNVIRSSSVVIPSGGGASNFGGPVIMKTRNG